MKITRRILSIPPRLTTTWSNVESLRVDDENRLWVCLYDSTSVCIPDIEKATRDRIFRTYETVLELEEHAEAAEKEMAGIDSEVSAQSEPQAAGSMAFPLKVNMEMFESLQAGMDGLGAMIQHDYSKSDSPDLPDQIINQLAQTARLLGADHADQLPKPEPHCNCPHCQVVRTIRESAGLEDEEELEVDHPEAEASMPISEEDLRFRDWDVAEESNNLYVVTNPLDATESYRVFLGSPIGCTCGQENCEHIAAALRT